jgi:myo-inositol 2-dehydrogenase/D-chiro-inositol 1-dehydrogenase
VRLAQIGLGRIGAFHAESLASRINGAELAWVVDADPARAEQLGRRFEVPWTSSYDEVLSDLAVDAVVISTPTPLHAEMIKGAAAAGKHVFCEKPLSLEPSRAAEAVAAVKRAQVKLQVGFQRRFDPDFRLVKAKIDDGSVGDIRFFRATCRDMRAPNLEYLRNCGGIFADVTLHDFDVARWLVGEIVEVYATGAALSDPAIAEVAGDVDNAVVSVKFANGALGVIDNSRASAYGYETSIEVMGSRSTLRVGQRAQGVSRVETLADAAVRSDIGVDFVTRFADGYVAAVAAFVRAVAEDSAPSPTGEDAVAAFTLALAAQRSMALNRPVPVAGLAAADAEAGLLRS